MPLVRQNVVHDVVADIARVSPVLVYIVGKLRLIEEYLTSLATPLNHILQRMLHSKPIHDDIVTCDHEAGVAAVVAVPDEAVFASGLPPMVCAPQPEVIANDITRRNVHHNPRLRLPLLGVIRTTHASEEV